MRMAQLPKVLKQDTSITSNLASLQDDKNKENHNQYIKRQDHPSKERPLF